MKKIMCENELRRVCKLRRKWGLLDKNVYEFPTNLESGSSVIPILYIVMILPCFSRRDDGPRKSNRVGDDDGLKQKK